MKPDEKFADIDYGDNIFHFSIFLCSDFFSFFLSSVPDLQLIKRDHLTRAIP